MTTMLKVVSAAATSSRRTGLLLTALLSASAVSYAEGRSVELSGGMDYSVGDYGQTQDTTVSYIPVSLKVRSNHWAYGITVPYVRITGPDNTVVSDGITTGDTAATGTRTDSGLGDVVLSAHRGFEPATSMGTYFDITGKVKIGTADETKGLGTGTNSYTLLLDAYQPMAVVDVFAALGYRINNSSDLIQLNNVWLGSVGVARQINSHISGGISYDFRGAPSAHSTAGKEITPYISWKLSQEWKVKGYAAFGLSKQSPDLAGGMQVVHTFH